VFSSVCGCSGLLRDVAGTQDVKNVIVADYTNLSECDYAEIEDLLQIDRPVRDQVEIKESKRVAEEIVQRLPQNESEIESLIRTGYRLAANMGWDVIVKNYLLSGLQKTPIQQQISNIER
jgi:hypothetical protein